MKVVVYNALGKVLMAGKKPVGVEPHLITIPTDDWSSGCYFVRVITGTGSVVIPLTVQK
jgi:hypothetical protein